MKQILILLYLITSSLILKGQTPISPVTFNTVADLRSQVGTDNVMVTVGGNLTSGDGNGGDYKYSASSTATDDGFLVVKPTAINVSNPGRYIYLPNQNTVKGSVTFSGIALQFNYTVPFGVTLPSVPSQVHIQATSTGAASANAYVDDTLTTTTTFTIKFRAIPDLGTNNIKFWYLVIKR